MKFKTVLTEKDFYDLVYKRSNSLDSVGVARAAVTNLKLFCLDVYKASENNVLRNLKNENDDEAVLNFVNDLIDWMYQDHPNVLHSRHPESKKTPYKKKAIKTIKDYVTFVRKFMKKCHSIRIDDDDWRDYIVYPYADDQEDEDAEPFTKTELKMICDHMNHRQWVKKNLIMVKKDTGFRIKEMMQARKRHFDTSKRPISLTLPRSIMKGKRAGSTGYVSNESTPGLLQRLKQIEDDDLVYTDNPDARQARNNFERWWNKLVQGLGYREKYPNGRLKKNIHSIKKFCGTQYAEANGENMMHGYLNHSKYLPMYNVLSEEKQVNMFRKAEPYLSIYEEIVVEKELDQNDIKRIAREVIEQMGDNASEESKQQFENIRKNLKN